MKTLVLLLLMLAMSLRLVACPAGYESPESLVRHARLIIELEVLSVSEAPLPPDLSAQFGNDNSGRSMGKAQVKVLNVIKGECASREFTLIGGPYHTCAPCLFYHTFKAGDKRMLILESPLPKNVKTVAITWRNRLLDENADQIRVLMDKARLGWKKAVDRHRRAAPEEMSLAEKMQAEIAKNPAYQIPENTSYGTLVCLAALWNDPDHLPAASPEEPDDSDWSSSSFLQSFYASRKVCTTDYASRAVLPSGLSKLLPKPAQFSYAPPPEAMSFNEKILKTILEDELFVPVSLTASIVKNPKLKGMWDRPQQDAFWLGLSRPDETTMPLEAMSLYYLMLMADPEPDSMVWSGFGRGEAKDAAFLPADLFVGFLEHYRQSFTEHDGALRILLRLPDPRIAPAVRAYVAKGLYDNSPGLLIRYFAQLGMEQDVLVAVSKIEKGVDSFINSLSKPKPDAFTDYYSRKRCRDDVSDALSHLGAQAKFKEAEERLQALVARLEAVKIKEP